MTGCPVGPWGSGLDVSRTGNLGTGWLYCGTLNYPGACPTNTEYIFLSQTIYHQATVLPHLILIDVCACESDVKNLKCIKK